MSAPEVEGSLLDPEIAACPFAHYRELHEKAPIHRMPETGFYVASGYDDVREILSDPVTYSNNSQLSQRVGESAAALGRVYEEHLADLGWGHVQTLQRTDPPDHSRYRRLLNRALTPPLVRAMLPDVERITDLRPRPFDSLSMYFGGTHAALWDPDNGLAAVADPRRTGGVAFGG